MTNREIVTQIVSHLSRHIVSPASEVLFAVTAKDVLTAIAQRMGEDALSLSTEEFQLAVAEVQEAICHGLDWRPYVEEGLDAWEITRRQ